MATECDFATACFVKDPETGEVLAVEHTTEYVRLILAFNEAECSHPNRTQYRVRVANGAVQVRNCCTNCGERIGSAVAQKDKVWVESLSWQPDDHQASYKSRRDAEREALLIELARRQYAERGRFTKSYSEYMKSDLWKSKRELVFRRCGNKCEGCGVAEATQVHHITYEHLFNEFLFELLGLCGSCHDRITKERREQLGGSEDVVSDF